jgi:hypothetical protein
LLIWLGTTGNSQAARFGNGKRQNRLRAHRRREQADDTAIGVPDQVVSIIEMVRNESGVSFEVDTWLGWVRWKPRPGEYFEPEPLS